MAETARAATFTICLWNLSTVNWSMRLPLDSPRHLVACFEMRVTQVPGSLSMSSDSCLSDSAWASSYTHSRTWLSMSASGGIATLHSPRLALPRPLVQPHEGLLELRE